MNVPSLFRHPALLVFVLAAAPAEAQGLPAIRPDIDPTFWGHPNKPYILKLTVTSTSNDGINPPHTHTSEGNVSRDSAGRERTEGFYDSGRPMSVSIRDPDKNTLTDMMVVTKRVFVISVPRPVIPPPGRGWTVERLPSRVIAGYPAEGFRFTRTIPASADGKRAEDTVVAEDWISEELSVVLEQKIDSQRTGTTTKTVSSIKQVEPDSALFSIPSDYTFQQNPAPVPPRHSIPSGNE